MFTIIYRDHINYVNSAAFQSSTFDYEVLKTGSDIRVIKEKYRLIIKNNHLRPDYYDSAKFEATRSTFLDLASSILDRSATKLDTAAFIYMRDELGFDINHYVGTGLSKFSTLRNGKMDF